MDTYSVVSMYVPMNICSSRKKHISAWAGDQYPLSIATSTSPAMSTLRQNQKKNSIIDCNASSSLSDCSLITKITCHILVTVKHANIQGKTFWHYPPWHEVSFCQRSYSRQVRWCASFFHLVSLIIPPYIERVPQDLCMPLSHPSNARNRGVYYTYTVKSILNARTV